MDNKLATQGEPNSTEESQSSHLLSREETREILTPFAFEIDKKLFGYPLASPYKRGFALLVDLCAIAILSGAPGELLAVVLAITFYRLGNNKRAESMGKVKGRKRRGISRFIGAFILFVLLVDYLPQFFEEDTYNNTPSAPISKSKVNKDDALVIEPSQLGLETSIILSKTIIDITKVMSESGCSDLACWKEQMGPVMTGPALLSVDLPAEFAQEAVSGVVEETGLVAQEQAELESYLLAQYAAAKQIDSPESAVEPENVITAPIKLGDDFLDSDAIEQLKALDEIEENKKEKPVYSIMEYVKGLIDDLGLGFGWAAFYFTVLTSIWKGQTLGKKLFSIRVLQLDGTPLSMWDSFGRYGGYGAGIATGLLGFIQIFWDANRQAIHDKISATVVVDTIKLDVNNER